MSSASHCLLNSFSKFDKRIRLAYRFNNLFAEFIHMRSGKDGEYYYAELSKDEVIKLKEIVEKKAKERTNVRKPSYETRSPK